MTAKVSAPMRRPSSAKPRTPPKLRRDAIAAVAAPDPERDAYLRHTAEQLRIRQLVGTIDENGRMRSARAQDGEALPPNRDLPEFMNEPPPLDTRESKKEKKP